MSFCDIEGRSETCFIFFGASGADVLVEEDEEFEDEEPECLPEIDALVWPEALTTVLWETAFLGSFE